MTNQDCAEQMNKITCGWDGTGCGKCDGWGGITLEQCIDYCISNEVAPGCEERQAGTTCAGARFWSASWGTHCHLSTDFCTDFKPSEGSLSVFTVARPPPPPLEPPKPPPPTPPLASPLPSFTPPLASPTAAPVTCADQGLVDCPCSASGQVRKLLFSVLPIGTCCCPIGV